MYVLDTYLINDDFLYWLIICLIVGNAVIL